MTPMTPADLLDRLSAHPRLVDDEPVTPIQPLQRLGQRIGRALWVKRDDATLLPFGGNKVRQLRYYIGAAQAQGADCLLITGAVQSNYARTAAAMAARVGMACHVQAEDRVPLDTPAYQGNGNVLLTRLLGASQSTYPEGEDEAGADRALAERAEALRKAGRKPYVIPLGASHPPLGALGYVEVAIEVAAQFATMAQPPEVIVVASGSALTHAGLALGLSLLGVPVRVQGICVRRPAKAQTARVARRLADTAALMDLPVPEVPVHVSDAVLAPGYGQLNVATREAITLAAQQEGLLLDPVYTGRTLAGLMHLAGAGALAEDRVLMWHTGGTAALFGYADQMI